MLALVGQLPALVDTAVGSEVGINEVGIKCTECVRLSVSACGERAKGMVAGVARSRSHDSLFLRIISSRSLISAWILALGWGRGGTAIGEVGVFTGDGVTPTVTVAGKGGEDGASVSKYTDERSRSDESSNRVGSIPSKGVPASLPSSLAAESVDASSSSADWYLQRPCYHVQKSTGPVGPGAHTARTTVERPTHLKQSRRRKDRN